MEFIEEKNNENNRILTSMGFKKCPLGCIYCFVENENYISLPVITLEDSDIFFKDIRKDGTIIQPASDIEFFLVPNSFKILENIADEGLDISFATKAKVSASSAKILAKINQKLLNKGAILNIAVSITCLHDWKEIEVNTPSPMERIESLRILFETGIPTTVAIRPLLPSVLQEEIEEIVEKTHKYTYGYLSGPLYITNKIKEFLDRKKIRYKTIMEKVTWLPGEPFMEKAISPELENFLLSTVEKCNLTVFGNNIEAISKIKKNIFSSLSGQNKL